MRALAELGRGLDADPEVAAIRVDRTPQHVDPTGRYLNVEVVGAHDYGDPASLAFVDRPGGDATTPALRLVESRPLGPDGIVLLTYEPIRADAG